MLPQEIWEHLLSLKVDRQSVITFALCKTVTINYMTYMYRRQDEGLSIHIDVTYETVGVVNNIKITFNF